MATSRQDVRIWSVQDRRGSKGYSQRPWRVRWRVDRREFQRTFRTRDEADHLRAELLVAQRNGEVFDGATGEPESWDEAGVVLAHHWVRRWLAEQWDEWQPRTRNSTVEEMSRFIPLLIKPSAPEPPCDIRLYLKDVLRPEAELDERAERWLDRWCLPLSDLDRPLLAEVDRQLGIGVNGKVLAATTASRYRKSARACLRRAVDLGLLDRDPWPPTARGAKNRKVNRKAKERAIDIRQLPDPPTMRRALEAMINHQPASRMYYTMTAVMAYGGLRPSEVVMLRPQALTLPESGWGSIDVVEADIDFDEPGDPKTGNRTVPIPAVLVEILRTWIASSDLDKNELIFRSQRGNRPSPSNWRRAWHLALRKINHEPLRPYDCRHTAATTWLRAGVPLGEVACRMGHSVQTLVATYVGALLGDEQASNTMIDRYLLGPDSAHAPATGSEPCMADLAT